MWLWGIFVSEALLRVGQSSRFWSPHPLRTSPLKGENSNYESGFQNSVKSGLKLAPKTSNKIKLSDVFVCTFSQLSQSHRRWLRVLWKYPVLTPSSLTFFSTVSENSEHIVVFRLTRPGPQSEPSLKQHHPETSKIRCGFSTKLFLPCQLLLFAFPAWLWVKGKPLTLFSLQWWRE